MHGMHLDQSGHTKPPRKLSLRVFSLNKNLTYILFLPFSYFFVDSYFSQCPRPIQVVAIYDKYRYNKLNYKFNSIR